MPEARRRLLWFGVAILIVALDHWSKHIAYDALQYGRPLEVLPFLNMTLQFNTGAAFSFLSEAGGWQRWFLSAVAVLAAVFISVWLWRLRADEKLTGAALAFILGGALGNLWDRLELGYVIDFVSLHYRGWYFPAFNLADAAITLGAVLMIADALGPYLARRRQGGSGGR